MTTVNMSERNSEARLKDAVAVASGGPPVFLTPMEMHRCICWIIRCPKLLRPLESTYSFEAVRSSDCRGAQPESKNTTCQACHKALRCHSLISAATSACEVRHG